MQTATRESAGITQTRDEDVPTPQSAPQRPRRSRQKVVWYTAAMLAAVTVGHYALPAQYSFAHNVLQRLFYIPIVFAAYYFGRRGGLITALIAGGLYVPHIVLGWQGHTPYQFSQMFEIGLFLVVGFTFGLLLEQKVYAQRQLQSYEKMALFGSLSRSVIRSLKSPIRALQGMVMSLEPKANRDPALAASLGVIRDEIERIAGIRNDLIALVQRRRLRLKRQNLNALMFEFEAQIGEVLRERGIRARKTAQDIRLDAHVNRPAVLSVLDRLTGFLIDGASPGDQLTLYSGQSAQYAWVGATADGAQLPETYPGDFDLIDYDHFRRYELIPVINVMNNHYGDVRFRWHRDRLLEFMLVFPRKVKLPWYLRDESVQQAAPRLQAAEV